MFLKWLKTSSPVKGLSGQKINFTIWLSLLLISVCSDQLSKLWARQSLVFNQAVEVIPNILHFRLLFNTGAAFSALSGQTFLLTIISLVACILLTIYSLQNINSLGKWRICALALITAGAIGNLIDRALFAQVTDFLDLLILPGDFPVFNLADASINMGVSLYLISLFNRNDEHSTKQRYKLF